MSSTTTELRCENCGEVWSEDGPACCADPVDQYMTVRRRRHFAAAGVGPDTVLIEVLNPRGEIVYGYWKDLS